MTFKQFIISSFLCGVAALSAFAEQPWQGQWISSQYTNSTPNTWIAFRKDFSVDQVPDSLTARIGADTKYWLWINGEPVVFEGGLKRGPKPGATYYDEVEIAPYLKEGDNTIALLLWHFGKNGFSHANSGTAAVIFDAAPVVVSDNSWRSIGMTAFSNTDAPHPNFRLAESNLRYDARKAIDGWNMPEGQVRMSPVAVITEAGNEPFGELVARPIPQWKNYGRKAYESTSTNGDTIRCRLPYNAQVTPYLKVNAPEGKTIHILTDNYNGGSAYNVRAEYITRNGVQEYENPGWMNGHQVLYVVPEGVEVLDLQYRETGYDCEFSGSFECDDPFLNELWKRSARTLYITMRDTYMDCPDRERAQWWGDAVNELGETFYALSPSANKLAKKGILELMNWQRDNGVIYSPVPSGNWRKELPMQMLASVGWYGFYTQGFYADDFSFVPEIYPGLKKYLHEVWQLDSDGLVVSRAGDWTWGDWGENIDMDILTNCWYYLALKAEREFAVMQGLDEDVAMIEGIMHGIENAFDSRFWNGDEYRSPSYTGETDDRAQAMAIVSGLASEDKYPALAQVLANEYHASPYMEKYVLEALFKMELPEQAMDRMHKRYAKMMNSKLPDGSDYTTLFEGWGIGAEGFGGGTVNHAWSGGPLTMLSQKVCGIEPTSPGFRTFAIRPQLGNLKEASATVETNYGLIKVALRREGRHLFAKFTVPEGTTASIDTRRGIRTFEGGTYDLCLTK
ncbi:MAG: glycoside hydrolase [Bacteroidales bacterium]|nr:glycoside hydrolase [Bacteroidales bacterium]